MYVLSHSEAIKASCIFGICLKLRTVIVLNLAFSNFTNHFLKTVSWSVPAMESTDLIKAPFQ